MLSAFIEWVPIFYIINEHDISPLVLFPWLLTAPKILDDGNICSPETPILLGITMA